MRRAFNSGIGLAAALALLHYAEQARPAQAQEPAPEPKPDISERRPGESRQAWRARLRAHAKGRRA